MKIDEVLVVGSPAGRGPLINAVLACSRSARFIPRLPEAWGEEPPSPNLVLVCQHWPDEFTREQVAALLTTFPLARFICAYGSWCESDGRTRDIWPAAVRVPGNQAIERLNRELEVIAGLRPPLPLTAGLDEIFAFDHDVN